MLKIKYFKRCFTFLHNGAGCNVLSREGAKVSTLVDIRQHKRYCTRRCKSFNSGWYSTTQNIFYEKVQKFQLWLIFHNTKHILREGAKVSTLVDYQQHKTYFTRRCKSFNSGWYSTTQKIFYRLLEPKQIIPKGGGGYRRRNHSTTNTRRCNGKSTNSPQSKVFQMEA
jgi:hypothetical protein